LCIEASNGTGGYCIVWHKNVVGPIFLSAAERRQRRRRTQVAAVDRFHWWLDRPLSWDTLERDLPICGWCVDRVQERITGFRARVGRKIFRGTYGIQRRDLRGSFPHSPYAHCAGFAVTAKLPPGRSTLALEVRDVRGQWHSFLQRQVIRQCSAARKDRPPPDDAELFDVDRQDIVSRFAFWLEPRCDWSRLPGTQRLVGWCVALHGEPVKAVRARIGHHTWEAQTGIKRPEVKAAYPDVTAALHSGFSVTIEPPRGRNLLLLEAYSTHRWEPFFAYRIYRPFFWRRGENRFGKPNRYEYWLRLYDKLDARDRSAIRRHIRSFDKRPRFSVLIPCYNSDLRFLRAAIRSVRRQLYPDWEICAVDDASNDPAVWRLLQSVARREVRIKIHRRPERGHISAASNDALHMATGDFIVLLDHDDELALHTLYFAALAINRQPDLKVIYGDEDKIDENGHRFSPHFKSQWNPDLFLVQNYAAHPAILHAGLARDAGGFHSEYDGAQDHEFMLRCVERIDQSQIKRIPWLLYHWRATALSTAEAVIAKPYALDARARAVEGYLRRRSIDAVVSMQGGFQRVRYAIPAQLASIIIPTRDQAILLEKCLRSIREKTEYELYEIVIVDNGSSEPSTRELFQEFASDERIRVISVPGEFNYSKLCNRGAAAACGQVLVFLNNDIEIIETGWLSELMSQVTRPEVGVVGASLWFPDGQLQHAGIVLSPERIGNYAYFRQRRGDPGYFSQLQLVRNVAAVTGACLAVRAEVYAQVGGLNERDLGIAFNDIDFCLRVRELNLRAVWTPYAELMHRESTSRGLEDTEEKQGRFHQELRYMQQRWREPLHDDPFYNPNLDLTDELFTLAFPPRLRAPWKDFDRANKATDKGESPNDAG
jgi:glycosyltransferase involved in cell wall biosynthesis